MSKTDITLSLVIPVYNEEKRLAITFKAIDAFIKISPFKEMEVVFVNDGSKDKTTDIIEQFKPGIPVKLVGYKQNQGKGFAVTTGMQTASMNYRLMLDADMSTAIEEILSIIPFMERGEHVIIGNRRIKGSVLVRNQPFYRRFMGRSYTLLANLITGVPVSDFTCGFKVFSKESSEKIFTKTKIKRWSYDTEILYLAHIYGYKIIEVPVQWTNDIDTKVSLLKDVLSSFIDLFVIRFNKYK